MSVQDNNTAADGTARRRIAVAGVLVCLIAIMPVILVRFPAMNDYPFHMARIVILSHLDLPQFDRFYDLGSFLLPNLAMDGLALAMAKIVSAETASRIFVALCIVSILVGSALLHRAAHGRWSPWSLMGVAIVHNGIFTFGFLNYLFGLGLAFAAAALWLVMRPGLPRLAIAFLCGIFLMYCHMEAFGVFALTVGSIEIFNAVRDCWRERSARPVLKAIYSAPPFLVTLALFAALSPTSDVSGLQMNYPSWIWWKPFGFLFSVSSGSIALDIATLAGLAGLVAILWRRRCLSLSGPLVVAAFAAGIAVFALPTGMLGAAYLDIRLGPVAVLLAIAAVDISGNRDRLARQATFATLFALAVLRSGVVAAHWIADEKVIAPIVAGMAPIEPGGTLFTATAETFPQVIAANAARRATWRPSTKHLGSYAVLNNPVFVPMTFANPTQQPLNIAPAYAAIKAFQGDTPVQVASPADVLAFLGTIRKDSQDGTWPKLGGVYALIQGHRLLPGLKLPDYVTPVAEGERFVLVRFSNP